jgi:hypothetical protein
VQHQVKFCESSAAANQKENPQMLSQMRAKASLLLEEISGDYRVIQMSYKTVSVHFSISQLCLLSPNEIKRFIEFITISLVIFLTFIRQFVGAIQHAVGLSNRWGMPCPTVGRSRGS